MLQDGFYTIVYVKAQTHRTLKIETIKQGGLAGRTVISYLVGPDNESDYKGFGFIDPQTGVVTFWQKFRAQESAERLVRILAAVKTIVGNPTEAGINYALKSSKCCRCGRTLTVPASIHNGMGPECAKRRAGKSARSLVAA